MNNPAAREVHYARCSGRSAAPPADGQARGLRETSTLPRHPILVNDNVAGARRDRRRERHDLDLPRRDGCGRGLSLAVTRTRGQAFDPMTSPRERPSWAGVVGLGDLESSNHAKSRVIWSGAPILKSYRRCVTPPPGVRLAISWRAMTPSTSTRSSWLARWPRAAAPRRGRRPRWDVRRSVRVAGKRAVVEGAKLQRLRSRSREGAILRRGRRAEAEAWRAFARGAQDPKPARTAHRDHARRRPVRRWPTSRSTTISQRPSTRTRSTSSGR